MLRSLSNWVKILISLCFLLLSYCFLPYCAEALSSNVFTAIVLGCIGLVLALITTISVFTTTIHLFITSKWYYCLIALLLIVLLVLVGLTAGGVIRGLFVLW